MIISFGLVIGLVNEDVVGEFTGCQEFAAVFHCKYCPLVGAAPVELVHLVPSHIINCPLALGAVLARLIDAVPAGSTDTVLPEILSRALPPPVDPEPTAVHVPL